MDFRVKRASLTEQVYFQLLRYIEEHGLNPDDELPTEMKLAQMFGVSRTVIREGLRAAAALGLIVTETGRRSRVAGLSSQALDGFFANALRLNTHAITELLEVREALETAGVRVAAQNPDPEHLKKLNFHLSVMGDALASEHHDEFVEADMLFHLTLVEMSGNDILQHLIRSLRSTTRQSIASGLQARHSNKDLKEIQTVHELILEAVSRSDPESAVAAMTKHFRLAIEAIGYLDRAAAG